MARPLISFLALLLAASGLRAEFPQMGIQALAEAPLKDFRAYTGQKKGLDLGLHGTFDLGDGELLRPRLDWTSNTGSPSGGAPRRTSSLALGADYLLFTQGMPEGLYVFLGAALSHWSFQGSDGGLLPRQATKGELGLGLGYQWSALLGTELRYVHAKPTSAFRADRLQAGLTLRF